MNTAILITARLKSTRLPFKVMKTILGKPMIQHKIDRLRASHVPGQIIMCTSLLKQDDPLEEISESENIPCFRGDPIDVLNRLLVAAETYSIDCFISTTGDNPFVDPIYIDRLLTKHISQSWDFSTVPDLPWGTFSYCLSVEALKKACNIKNEMDTEVWGGYFTETGIFKTGELPVTEAFLRRPKLRLTVDTPEDFALATAIIEELYEEDEVFSLMKIIELLDSKPELLELNADVVQKARKPIKLKNNWQSQSIQNNSTSG
jgi:spore coat polysaccharide biosynthesis protein SpsF